MFNQISELKRAMELRVELLQNKLAKKCTKVEAAQINNELEFLERVLDEIKGTATGDLILDLSQGEPQDWLIQHPLYRNQKD